MGAQHPTLGLLLAVGTWALCSCREDATSPEEPAKASTEPPPAPETTAPEPTGAARLRLVDGNFSCSGFVELYRQGLWGAVGADADTWPELASRICEAVNCGKLVIGHSTVPEAGSHLPVRWEMEKSCKRHSVLDCFNETSDHRGKVPAFVICSGESLFGKRAALVMCPPSDELTSPMPVGWLVHGQDSKPQPAGLGAGTIMSILLALVLFGILLLICGPPAYKRLMKKISKKKQRQWIGPTGFNQNVSFHRNSTVNLRPRAEGPRAQGEDNDYAQPPKKNPYLSAYPALEGASRSSNPPDNSSDSDYDLHSARRV
ncbi:PREDICTED: T-cell surface glycoprotein CD5 [Tinamus guttatus]|uniref:T-cell surface glycoprotein CD5 n=1 Tax=Tinamus guttatus TaxID=94827 RepID=UPI00052E9470|nr:PREDICTED: T-cell surface glycoprotein CD5 [Tinamus guttatus]